MQYNRETVGDSTICDVMWKHLMASLCMGKKKFHLSTTISARLRPSFLTMTAALSVIFTISPVKLSTQSILIMPGSSAGRTAVLIIPSRFFFLILYFLCFFQGNGNNFLLSLSLRPFSLSRRWNVKPLFWGVFCCFFFFIFLSFGAMLKAFWPTK